MLEVAKPPGKRFGPRARWRMAGALFVAGLLAYVVEEFATRRAPSSQPAPPPVAETIPPGIIVSESSSAMAVPSNAGGGSSPGDTILAGYAGPLTDARQDLVLLSRALSNFLLLEKSAAARPLSANEEWSKAVAGKRSGAAPWFSLSAPVWNAGGLLADRWQRPLHFHALGGGKWEVRSLGPDGRPYSQDDLVELLPPK